LHSEFDEALYKSIAMAKQPKCLSGHAHRVRVSVMLSRIPIFHKIGTWIWDYSDRLKKKGSYGIKRARNVRELMNIGACIFVATVCIYMVELYIPLHI
jgi:hypothetical protein